jgi:YHS domain-containing protein
MSFLARVMRFLFWVLILSWGVALLRRTVGWMLRGSMPGQTNQNVSGAGAVAGADEAQGGVAARRLVRDPVCGMHVAEVLSVPLREGGEILHFCSAECRDKYVKDTQRVAANG